MKILVIGKGGREHAFNRCVQCPWNSNGIHKNETLQTLIIKNIIRSILNENISYRKRWKRTCSCMET